MSWKLGGKLVPIFIIIIFYAFCVKLSLTHLSLELTILGKLNVLIIASILVWYMLDFFYIRRELYSFFSRYFLIWLPFIPPIDPPVFLEVRFFRLNILMVLIVLATISASAEKVGFDPGSNISTNTDFVRSVVFLIGSYLAAFGWSFTNFQKQQTDRAIQSRAAIREALRGTISHEVHHNFTQATQRAWDKIKKDDPERANYEIKLFYHTDMDEIINLPYLSSSPRELYKYVDKMFNALDRLALGVRLGHLEYKTVSLVIRIRYVRYIYVYSEYIKRVTNADCIKPYKNCTGRCNCIKQSNSRVWEHMLWLTYHMALMPKEVNDELTDKSRFIYPPDHIYGSTRVKDYINGKYKTKSSPS